MHVCVRCMWQVHGLQSQVLKALQLWDSRATPARISGCYANRWQVNSKVCCQVTMYVFEECPLCNTASCNVCGGGERSGSVGSIGSVRSSSSLQSSGNTHVLTTPAPSPHPATTPGVNTHGLNAPGLHAQAEGVKVRDFFCVHVFARVYITLLLNLYKTASTSFLGNDITFSGNKHKA